MTKVIVCGAAGRMGQRISYMVSQNPDLQLVGGFEQADNPDVGRDIGEVAGFGNIGVAIAPDLPSIINDGDVLIDFTTPESSGDTSVGISGDLVSTVNINGCS